MFNNKDEALLELKNVFENEELKYGLFNNLINGNILDYNLKLSHVLQAYKDSGYKELNWKALKTCASWKYNKNFVVDYRNPCLKVNDFSTGKMVEFYNENQVKGFKEKTIDYENVNTDTKADLVELSHSIDDELEKIGVQPRDKALESSILKSYFHRKIGSFKNKDLAKLTYENSESTLKSLKYSDFIAIYNDLVAISKGLNEKLNVIIDKTTSVHYTNIIGRNSNQNNNVKGEEYGNNDQRKDQRNPISNMGNEGRDGNSNERTRESNINVQTEDRTIGLERREENVRSTARTGNNGVSNDDRKILGERRADGEDREEQRRSGDRREFGDDRRRTQQRRLHLQGTLTRTPEGNMDERIRRRPILQNEKEGDSQKVSLQDRKIIQQGSFRDSITTANGVKEENRPDSIRKLNAISGNAEIHGQRTNENVSRVGEGSTRASGLEKERTRTRTNVNTEIEGQNNILDLINNEEANEKVASFYFGNIDVSEKSKDIYSELSSSFKSYPELDTIVKLNNKEIKSIVYDLDFDNDKLKSILNTIAPNDLLAFQNDIREYYNKTLREYITKKQLSGVIDSEFRSALRLNAGITCLNTEISKYLLNLEHDTKINEKEEEIVNKEEPKDTEIKEVINTEEPSVIESNNINKIDYQISDNTLGNFSKKERFNYNISAIKVLKTIEKENRLATKEEQIILSKYTGWGAIPEAFDENNIKWVSEYNELKNLLTDDEYKEANKSILSSFYTQPVIVKAIYNALNEMGFKGGKILEPSCGVGNFIGLMPEDMRKESQINGVELDTISGKIARQLYQNANIDIKGFEKVNFKNNYFDVAIGNVPFGDFSVFDPNEPHFNNLKGFRIHDYFFAKTLEKVRAGGIVALITSTGTLDKKSTEVRKYLSQRAEFLGSIRLPDTAFKGNAGTEAQSDIIFLRKRDKVLDKALPTEKQWVNLSEIECRWRKTNNKGDKYELKEYDDIKESQSYDMPFMINEFVAKKLNDKTKWGNFSARDEDYEKVWKNENIVSCPYIESSQFGDDIVWHENGNIKRASEEETISFLDKTINNEIKELNLKGTYKEAELDESNDNNPYIESENTGYSIVKGDKVYLNNKLVEFDDEISIGRKKFNGSDIYEELKLLININTARLDLNKAMLGDDTQKTDYCRNELNNAYDKYVNTYGQLHDNESHIKGIFDLIKDNLSGNQIMGLEVPIKDDNEKDIGFTKAQLFKENTIKKAKLLDKVDSAQMALNYSLSQYGKVDMDFMCDKYGKTAEEICNELKGFIFYDPVYKEYISKEEYLSGNIPQKIKELSDYIEDHENEKDIYEFNLQELNRVKPIRVRFEDIKVGIGSSVISTDSYEDFIKELLDEYHCDIVYSQDKGYTIKNKSNFYNTLATDKYGTKDMSAVEIFEHLLNNKTIKLGWYDDDKKWHFDPQKTAIACSKADLIKEMFNKWIQNNERLRNEIEDTYNEKFNSIVPREYDGSYLELIGSDSKINLYKHQKNAIAHILHGNNTLLAHCVGAGKTWEMCGSIMEGKRLGLITKAMVCVPNHMTEQFGKEFKQLYPTANVLIARKEDFKKDNREKFFHNIANNNYDAVIIGHSQLVKIPMSLERQIATLKKEIEELDNSLSGYNSKISQKKLQKAREKAVMKLDKAMEEIKNRQKNDQTIEFEMLGIDKLYIDECHYFKNLQLNTRIDNINSSDSQRALDLYSKCLYMNEITNNKGIVFASGTPISNSLCELYTLFKYLNNDKLMSGELGFTSFDEFVGNFGELETRFKSNVSGTGLKMEKRFTKFNNLPELINMYSEFADTKTLDQLISNPETNIKVPECIKENIVTKPSEYQKAYMKSLGERETAIDSGSVDPTKDNKLKLMSEGISLSIDPRLLDPSVPEDENSKINTCVKKVVEIYKNNEDTKATQLIFLDRGTPNAKENLKNMLNIKDKEKDVDDLDSDTKKEKDKFYEEIEGELDTTLKKVSGASMNLYKDIREKLVKEGIPEEEIKFIHDAKTDEQKQKLYDDMNNGKVRVLIGSTSKLGAGTNVQRRLIAEHLLDTPWRPADYEQRLGRMVRQKNQNKKVYVYKYLTEGTLDSKNWEILEEKQKFISQIITSKTPLRSYEDISEFELEAGQIKAITNPNPEFQRKLVLEKDVNQLRLLRGAFMESKAVLQQKIDTFPEHIKTITNVLNKYKEDINIVKAHENDEFKMVLQGKAFTGQESKKEAGAFINELLIKARNTGKEMEIGTYKGFKILVNWVGYKPEAVLRGAGDYRFELGSDVLGNITRIDNRIKFDSFSESIKKQEGWLEEEKKDFEQAKEQIKETFPKQQELDEKSKELEAVNILLSSKTKQDDLDEER